MMSSQKIRNEMNEPLTGSSRNDWQDRSEEQEQRMAELLLIHLIMEKRDQRIAQLEENNARQAILLIEKDERIAELEAIEIVYKENDAMLMEQCSKWRKTAEELEATVKSQQKLELMPEDDLKKRIAELETELEDRKLYIKTLEGPMNAAGEERWLKTLQARIAELEAQVAQACALLKEGEKWMDHAQWERAKKIIAKNESDPD
jgi:hypothetical protein